MFLLRRLHLDQVGDPSARFSRTTVDCTDPEDGSPLDTIVWLRNGGGKTSLLGLVFSLILPGLRDYITGRRDSRCLADYVLSGDTSHVVAEWEGPFGPVVTGAVYEWPDRRRPGDHRQHQGELIKAFYAFRPRASTLTFETVPVRGEDGRRAALADVIATLRALGRAHPALDLRIARDIASWHRALAELHLDPAVFRYQKDMNGKEGSVDELFRFPTHGDFVNFFIDLVADDEAPASVAARLGQVADRLARRPRTEAELEFCMGTADRLEPLAGQWDDACRLEAHAVEAAHAAASLAAALSAGQAVAATERDRLGTETTAAEERLTETRTSRRQAGNRAAEHRRRAAQFWVVDATAITEAAIANQTAAATEVAGWDALHAIISDEAARATLRRLDDALAALGQQAEPDRQARNMVAARLLARLDALKAAARAAETIARDEADNAAAESRRLREESTSSGKQSAAAAARADALMDRLAKIAADLDLAVRDGARRLDETAAGALARARADRVAADGALARLDAARATRQARREEITAQRAPLAKQAAEARAEQHQATEEADTHEADATAITGTERARELTQSDNPDLWSAGAALTDRLAAEIHDADRRLVAAGVSAARDRHVLDALGAGNRLLPPSEDVEAVLDALTAAGVPALPGLAFLSSGVTRARWDETIAAHPGLLAGIVVDAAHFDRAVRAAVDAGLHPASLVTIARKSAVLDLSAGEAATVVPPSPALYDTVSAESERARLSAALDQVEAQARVLTEQARGDRELKAAVERLLSRCPGGHIARLRRTADDAAQRAARHEERDAALTAEEAELNVAETGDTEERSRQTEIAFDAVRRQALLGPLAAAEAERPGIQAARDAADADSRALAVTAAEAAAAADEANGAALAARERAAEHKNRTDGYIASAAAITYVGDPPDLLPVDDRGADVAVLSAELAEADERFRRAVTDEVLFDRRERAAKDAAETGDSVGRCAPAALHTAAGLRATYGLPDVAGRRQHRQEAEEAERSATVARVRAEADLAAAETEKAAAGEARGRQLDAAEEPSDRGDAMHRQAAEEKTAARLQVEETALERSVVDLNTRRDLADRRATVLGLLQKTIGTALGPGITCPVGAPFAGSTDEAEAAQVQAVELVAASRSRAAEAHGLVRATFDALRQFAGRFPDLRALAEPVLADDPADVAADAAGIARLYRERADVLAGDLQAIAADRAILVNDLFGQVRRVLDLLTRAGRTHMPDTLGRWGGRAFLTVAFPDDEDEDELRRRVGVEIDTIVSGGKVPSGLDTLKRAVHAAVPKGFRVRVLKPTPDLTGERVDIPLMTDWSGGEKLTAAVVLYCILARLRSGGRHLSDSGSGVLILDNPLGTSNYVRFVALQRRVAAALSVQLIYTTGVHDLSAVGTFPNVVRCRNVRPPSQERRFVDATERLGEAHGTTLGEVTARRVARLGSDAEALAALVPDGTG